jgi:hypothetical protein
MSLQERARKKLSRPCMMVRDISGATGSTIAPSPANHFATASTAALTSGSTGMPTPASSSRPMRRPRSSPDRLVQAMSCTGRLIPSRWSGLDSTDIISAVSSTVRVIGPATRAT